VVGRWVRYLVVGASGDVEGGAVLGGEGVVDPQFEQRPHGLDRPHPRGQMQRRVPVAAPIHAYARASESQPPPPPVVARERGGERETRRTWWWR
jgi:hypothetical protein